MFKIGKILKEMLDEDYPSSFNWDTFKSLRSHNARLKYCTEHLKRINSGTARVIFQIDDEKVLKLAKNDKGVAQNEEEINMSGYYGTPDCLAKVFEVDGESHLWLEMELVTKVTPKIWLDTLGFSFKDYEEAITFQFEGTKGRMSRDELQDIFDVEWYGEVADLIGSYDVMYGDLTRINSFGVSASGEIVIVDFGGTGGVIKHYYSVS